MVTFPWDLSHPAPQNQVSPGIQGTMSEREKSCSVRGWEVLEPEQLRSGTPGLHVS